MEWVGELSSGDNPAAHLSESFKLIIGIVMRHDPVTRTVRQSILAQQRKSSKIDISLP